PQRWDWGLLTRLRPWWWLALRRLSPNKALTVNAAIFLALLTASVFGSSSGTIVWTALSGAMLPFSFARAYRVWRIEHPAKASWMPPPNPHTDSHPAARD
ncbi:MAG: hypothetical protein WCD11_24510, partial [Solirubrobacteraceae bacterium]